MYMNKWIKNRITVITITFMCILGAMGCNKSKESAGIESTEIESANINAIYIAEQDDTMYVSSPDGLNMRESPSTDSKKIRGLPTFAKVTVLEKNDIDVVIDNINSQWFKVQFENDTGWVFGGYLSKDKYKPVLKADSKLLLGDWETNETYRQFRDDGTYDSGWKEDRDNIWSGKWSLKGETLYETMNGGSSEENGITFIDDTHIRIQYGEGELTYRRAGDYNYFGALCCSGAEAEIRAAIKNGADINGKDRNGRTPLMHALDNSNTDAIQVLLKSGASVDTTKNGRVALSYAAMHADSKKVPTVLTVIINAGANVNEEDGEDVTPLMSVANNIDAMKVLINAGADINLHNKKGVTALMWAASYPNIDTLNALINEGSDVNAANNDGKTVLMYAASGERYESHANVVKALLDAGADITARDNTGKSALDYNRDYGWTDTRTILKDAAEKAGIME
jgi:hypothetical protein